jgi:hypothetical protein
LDRLEAQRHPIGTNTVGWAVAGLAVAAALVSRKKNDKSAK